MKQSVEFGENKTPSQLHSQMTKEMVAGYGEFPQHAEQINTDSFELHKDYIVGAPQLGSVPMPQKFKQAVTSDILMDKLGQRLAYERSGVRLYDAFIMKCKAAQPDLSIEVLERFRAEELAHFELIRDCIEALGGDSTAQTPCADASGVMAMGLIQLLNDPRSTIPQCVEAMLTAELTDVAAWDLLIELTAQAGLENFTNEFAEAKATEDMHLTTMQQWLTAMTLQNDVVEIPVQ